jgi:hypothetical protein
VESGPKTKRFGSFRASRRRVPSTSAVTAPSAAWMFTSRRHEASSVLCVYDISALFFHESRIGVITLIMSTCLDDPRQRQPGRVSGLVTFGVLSPDPSLVNSAKLPSPQKTKHPRLHVRIRSREADSYSPLFPASKRRASIPPNLPIPSAQDALPFITSFLLTDISAAPGSPVFAEPRPCMNLTASA